MLNRVAFLCWAFAIVITLPCYAATERSGIIFPSSERPARLTPGETLQVEARLSLPLTPPPGVQQRDAWEGWSVQLSKVPDLAYGTTPKPVSYTARLLRIRPGDRNIRYRISVVPVSWIPNGRYDLTLSGPGFSFTATGSVQVGESVQKDKDAIRIQRISQEQIAIYNRSATQWNGELDVLLEENTKGIRLHQNGQPVMISSVAWGATADMDTFKRYRVVRFSLVVPPSKGIDADEGSVQLTITPVALKTSSPSIRFEGFSSTVRPVDWHTLSIIASFDPVNVAWDFGDGESGTGMKVQHRWMFSDKITATATVFDGNAGVHEATYERSMEIPLTRRGCSCSGVGAGGRSAEGNVIDLLDSLFFSCI